MSSGLVPSIMGSAKNSPAEGINSLFGTNLLNAGGASNDPMTHWMNGVTGFNVMNAGSPQSDAAKAGATPNSIPTLTGGMTGQIPGNWNGQPNFANPNSWGMPTPQGGFWNQIAQQMAGPVYTGGLQVPGVSPAMGNMPIGSSGKGGMTSGGGKGGLVPTNPTSSPGISINNSGIHNNPFGGGSFNLGRRAGYQTQ